MAHLITRPTTVDFLEQQEERGYLNELLAQIDVEMAELAIGSGSLLVGKTVREAEVRGKGSFIVVALRQADGTTKPHPGSTQTIAAGDTLIVLGHQGDLPAFARHYALESELRYRGAPL